MAGLAAAVWLQNTPRPLAEDPLDTGLLSDRAMALIARGDTPGALDMARFVQTRTRRDAPVLAMMMQQALKDGRFAEAIDDIDILLRMDGEGRARDGLFAVLMAAADVPEARAPLVKSLSRSPWWRTAFVQALAERGSLEGARSLLIQLRSGPKPAPAVEFAPLILRQTAKHNYAAAYRDWLALTPAGRAPGVGDFNTPPDQTPFTWSAPAGAGGVTEASPGPTADVLRIDYDGFSLPDLPQRLLLLPPGVYRLNWRRRTEGAADPISLTLTCADSPATVQRAASVQNGAWLNETVTAVVPQTACPAVWLRVTPQPGERRAPSVTWITDLRLTPANL